MSGARYDRRRCNDRTDAMLFARCSVISMAGLSLTYFE